MNTDGGFGERIRVPSAWVIAPNPFETATKCAASAARLSMVYGTAGLTAALCVSRLLQAGRAKSSDGTVLVTGASGGVGSVSIEILSKLGFSVAAVSGKASDPTAKQKLMDLGAAEVVVSGRFHFWNESNSFFLGFAPSPFPAAFSHIASNFNTIDSIPNSLYRTGRPSRRTTDPSSGQNTPTRSIR